MTEEKILKSTCGMCSASCGVLVHVAEVTKITGDPDSPISRGAICPKGLAAPEFLYHPDRLRHPLRRVGDRGRGEWAQISWDDAVDIIAGKFIYARDTYGPESIAFILGSAKGLIDSYTERLANAFGTPNVSTTGYVCFLPRLYASQITYGSFAVPDYEHPPACMVVWGANLAETRIGEHHRMATMRNRDTCYIIVDPVRSALSEKAHIWLQLRPGSDLALALGMIHFIINEGLFDKAFVEHFTVGFKRLKEHIQGYSPHKVADITWVPSEKICNAAELYARTKPASIQWGNAIDHGVNSFQTARALAILRAITGNLDVPGGDVQPIYPLRGLSATDIPLRKRISPNIRQKRVDAGHKRIPLFQRVLPQSLGRAILTQKPYPIHGVYIHASNPLLTFPNTQGAFQALEKVNFLAVSDFFMTPTAAMADIVLPAATYLEYDSVVAPPYYPFAQVRQKAVKIDECRSDFEIVNQLSKRLGLQDLFWENMEDFFDMVLEPAGLSFKDFRKKGALTGTIQYYQYEKEGFHTPSGKVELYSDKLQSWGYDPMPAYLEPPETSFSNPDLAKEYPLVMTNRKSIFFLHSCGRQVDSLRRRHPDPVVYIHPKTAGRFFIQDGDWVFIETQRGRIKQKASLSEKVDPRVVCVDYGWWFPEKGVSSGFGWSESNVNILTSDQPPFSKEMGSANLRGILCKIYTLEDEL
jgi:anaerobic selenocysteine-containing dehydrogenase